MLHTPYPIPILIFAAICFIGHLYKQRRERSVPPPIGYDPLAEEKQMNKKLIETVVEAHTDCTAEVVNVFVKGRKRVNSFRQVKHGNEVKLVLSRNNVNLYAHGRFMCTLILPVTSMIPQLLKENAHIEAYLGGRDMQHSYNEDADFASIIVFYKVEGLPPTKVILNPN